MLNLIKHFTTTIEHFIQIPSASVNSSTRCNIAKAVSPDHHVLRVLKTNSQSNFLVKLPRNWLAVWNCDHHSAPIIHCIASMIWVPQHKNNGDNIFSFSALSNVPSGNYELFKKMHLNMSSGQWRPFCLGLNVITGTKLWIHLHSINNILYLMSSRVATNDPL